MANGANYWDVDDKIKYFWARIDKRGEDECWPWQGGKNQHGIGQIYAFKTIFTACRAAWEIQNNLILTRNMLVTHSCTNILCCNQKHLFIMTRTEKQTEMVKNKTHFPPPKLNQTEVIEIRRLFSTDKFKHSELGKMFNVSDDCISEVVNYRSWKWVIDS